MAQKKNLFEDSSDEESDQEEYIKGLAKNQKYLKHQNDKNEKLMKDTEIENYKLKAEKEEILKQARKSQSIVDQLQIIISQRKANELAKKEKKLVKKDQKIIKQKEKIAVLKIPPQVETPIIVKKEEPIIHKDNIFQRRNGKIIKTIKNSKDDNIVNSLANRLMNNEYK